MASYIEAILKEHKETIKQMVVQLRALGFADVVIVSRFFPVSFIDKMNFTESEATAYLEGYLPGLEKKE